MSNRGSEWRKWNFHVHTKGTNKNDQFTSASMDDFFCAFFKKAYQDKIEAIGITDYFSIDRYLDAINYVKEIHSKEDDWCVKLFTDDEIKFIQNIFLFPNVELRMLPATDKARLINIHCIFNPNYVSHLENDFFGHIENQDGFKMNKHGLIEYGRSQDDSGDDNKLYKKGVDNFVIDLKTLKKLISNNKNFRENCLLIVSNSNNDGASAIQKHYDMFDNEDGSLDGLRKSIYKLSHAVFSTNPKDIKYFLGKRHEGTDGYNEKVHENEIKEVIKHRGSLKSCLVGCDSHSEDTLFNRFTWLKADLTFEGLKQICYEPEQRVKIQSDKPDFKEDKVIIDNVRFISPNKVFTDEKIYLNPNLNVIIGGKSSGKSIFLYSIAKTLLVDNTVLKNDNSEEKYNLKLIDTDFDFEITTSAGITQRMLRDVDENSIIPDIKYIPQNYLVKLAEPEINKKGKSLNKLVRDLINEDADSKFKYDQFIRNVKQNDKDRDALIDRYFELQQDILANEAELRKKSNKEVLEKNIKTNTENVEKLNKESGLSEEKIAEYKGIQEKLEFNTLKANDFKEDYVAVKDFFSDLEKYSNEIYAKKKEFIEKIRIEEVKKYYDEKLAFIDNVKEIVNETIEELKVETDEEGTRFFKNDNILKSNLDSINTEKELINKQLEPFQQNKELKKQIEILNVSIAEDKKLLLDIEFLNKSISEKKGAIENCHRDIFKLYKDNYREYIDIINELKDRTFELESDGLKIDGIAQFNFPKLFKMLYEISDGRRASYNNYNILDTNRKATSETDFDIITEEMEKIFIDILNGNYYILPRITPKQAIKTLLDDYFFDYWKITYKKDKLGEMSTGKASFVILMLIIGLSRSKAPILIDQPEDNLDNRSITLDLVYYLKNKKLERQIIIVTHNANIVVNSDAENVIVANQEGQNDISALSNFRFDLINGSIENSFEKKSEEENNILTNMGIREHIADIVEGGKEAFKKREEKYGF